MTWHLEQNGLINIFSMAFLCVRTKRNFFMLVFTDGPPDVTTSDILFRELGLTLYTNKLIKILDDQKSDNVHMEIVRHGSKNI